MRSLRRPRETTNDPKGEMIQISTAGEGGAQGKGREGGVRDTHHRRKKAHLNEWKSKKAEAKEKRTLVPYDLGGEGRGRRHGMTRRAKPEAA